MNAHLKYLRYLLRHKWFVYQAGKHTGVSLWRRLKHDWSKFLPSEWFAYVEYFYGVYVPANRSDPSVRPNEDANKADWEARSQGDFDSAWRHHQHRNDHHWQHHLLHEDNGGLKVIEMPESALREMVADWMGAGRAITGKWEALAWYEQNKNNMTLYSETRSKVEQLLSMMHDIGMA